LWVHRVLCAEVVGVTQSEGLSSWISKSGRHVVRTVKQNLPHSSRSWSCTRSFQCFRRCREKTCPTIRSRQASAMPAR